MSRAWKVMTQGAIGAAVLLATTPLGAQAAGARSGAPVRFQVVLVDRLPQPNLVGVVVARKASPLYMVMLRRSDPSARYLTRAENIVRHGFRVPSDGAEIRSGFSGTARTPLSARERGLQRKLSAQIATASRAATTEPGYGLVTSTVIDMPW